MTEAENAEDLETLLAKDMGQMGRHQRRVLMLCTFVNMVSCISTNEFVFTAGRINTRCLIPECDNLSQNIEFAPSWILNAVPSTGDNFDSCHRFTNTSIAGTGGNDTCPATWFSPDTVVNCNDYVYERNNTVVYDFGMACDEWRRSMIGSVRIFGALLSLPIAGMMSDRWGRRATLTIVSFTTACMGLLRCFASNYIGFVISVFFESALGAGAILTCGYILLMESAPAKFRAAIGTASNFGNPIGEVILGLVAWALPYWKHFTLALYAPQLISIAYIWIFPESIRWYLSKGRYDDAETALKRMTRTNGKEISEVSLLKIKQAAMRQNNKDASKKISDDEPWLVVQVFRHKPILVRCMIIPVWWISMTLAYYGLSINAVNISGNPYLNYIAVAAIEVPAFLTAILINVRVDRRLVLMAAYWLCAIGQIAFIFIPDDQYAISLSVYLISKYGISIVGTTLYIYTTELYPTRYRQTFFNYSSMMGRIGSIAAPLTPALGAMVWKELPFALFAGFALVSGLLMLLTPETRGCPLPNTLQEAADIGRKSPPSEGDKTG